MRLHVFHKVWGLEPSVLSVPSNGVCDSLF
jgi:hypothetical protein